MMTKSWRLRWVGHVVRMGDMRNVYKMLNGKAEGREETTLN
jgi:hypothetical protein